MTDQDDAYFAIPATLSHSRHRRMFTFSTPLQLVISVLTERNRPEPIRISAIAGQGVADGATERSEFLVLDLVVHLDGKFFLPTEPVGVWVRTDQIAAAQIKVPRLGGPASILDIPRH